MCESLVTQARGRQGSGWCFFFINLRIEILILHEWSAKNSVVSQLLECVGNSEKSPKE